MAAGVVLGLCQCSSTGPAGDRAADCVVSVKEQKIAFYRDGVLQRTYPVSTSKFGIGDKPGQYGTPEGLLEVVAKIGHGAKPGTVFHSRQPTGEVIKPGAVGRDPIVSRIMWLRGLEPQNKNAYGRCIYIHGTADEADIGKPVSWGCIRMKSNDVMDLFGRLPIGAKVLVVQSRLPSTVPMVPSSSPPIPSSEPPLLVNPDSAGMMASNSRDGTPEATGGLPPVRTSRAAETAASQALTSSYSASGYQAHSNSDGSVVYSAPGNSLSPNVVMKSSKKRPPPTQANSQ